jgi:predicted RNase H-like HicB family nuclease
MTKSFVVVIERAGRNYSAYAPEVPGCVATGATPKEAEDNMRSALQMHMEGLAEDGLQVPADDVLIRHVRLATR